MSVRRPPAPSRSSCSRHSSRPAAKRTASAATNWPRRSLLGGQLRQRAPGGGRQVRAEDGAGGLVGDAHRQRAVDRQHAGRQARQDDRQALALALHRLLAVRRLVARAPQALGHVVEGVHQEAHLVARGQRQARAEVALADRARARDQVLHRAHQALRGIDGAVDGRQHRQQQHQGERQAEAALQRLAQRREIAVLRYRCAARPRRARPAAAAPGRRPPRSAPRAPRRVAAAARRCG